MATVKILPDWAADNRLKRILLYTNNVRFNAGAVDIPSDIVPPLVGTPVVKVEFSLDIQSWSLSPTLRYDGD